MNLLKRWKFSRLTVSNESQTKKYFEEKVNLLFSQFCILGTFILFLHTIVDFFQAGGETVVSDAVFLVALILFYVLNESRHHILVRHLMINFVNLYFFVVAAISYEDVGIGYLYFPLIAITYIFFGQARKIILYPYLMLSTLCVFILMITDYKPLGNLNLLETGGTSIVVLNMMTSFLLLIIVIEFLVNLYHKTIANLEKNTKNLEEMTREIQGVNEALKKTNAELDTFVYSTSHDLRSPLMSVLGLVGIARKDEKAENRELYYKMIEERIHALDISIKNIIDYSRNSRIDVAKEPIDFDHLIDDVVNSLAHMENADKITFQKTVEVAPVIFHDKKRIEAVLNNLVANAIKYHDVTKEAPRIEVIVSAADELLKISVKDNGTGIDPAYQQKIFTMFFRASERSKGSGLGLFIVKETVSKMGGKIELDSVPGLGSCFTIELPLTKID